MKKKDTAWLLEHIKKALTGLVESENEIVQIREKLVAMLLTKIIELCIFMFRM